jgi:hypothetical protein
MQIFINEVSLNNQYDDARDFKLALKTFLSSIKKISEIGNNKKEVFKSDTFFYYTGLLDGTHLNTMLKSNPELNSSFVQNMQLLNPKKWEDQRIHETNSKYEFQGKDYVNTSIAELAERKFQNKDLVGFLLNFSNSIFGDSSRIEIIRDEKSEVSIDCAIYPENIENWLINNNFINVEDEYDENSGIPPTDRQTVLRDTQTFEKTDYPKNNYRTVYRRIGTNELWAVDGAKRHAGSKAHIEVFDEKTGKHLGTSLYNKIEVNHNFAKKDRSINLKD